MMYTLPQLCRSLKLDYQKVSHRILDGWSIDEIIACSEPELDIDYDLLRAQALQTYQKFFLTFKDDDRMKNLIQEWNKEHHNDLYFEREDPLLDFHKGQASEQYKEKEQHLKNEIHAWKEQCRIYKEELSRVDT